MLSFLAAFFPHPLPFFLFNFPSGNASCPEATLCTITHHCDILLCRACAWQVPGSGLYFLRNLFNTECNITCQTFWQ